MSEGSIPNQPNQQEENQEEIKEGNQEENQLLNQNSQEHAQEEDTIDTSVDYSEDLLTQTRIIDHAWTLDLGPIFKAFVSGKVWTLFRNK